MPRFRITIAGKTAQVDCLFESTPLYLGKYRSDAPPDFSVSVSEEDIAFERRMHLQEALEEGFRIRDFPDTFLERAAIQRKMAEGLLPYDILLFHGSAIAADGAGYLFTAPSGVGKSTHTRLWMQCLGSRAVMINDDKPFLRFEEQEIFVCGSPWSGKHGLDTNLQVPLRGICLLERAPENRVEPLAQEQLAFVRKQAYCPLESAGRERAAALMARLTAELPLWQLRCNKTPEAAEAAIAAMHAPAWGSGEKGRSFP